MDRYILFRRLMELLTDDCEIVDAKMKNWDDAIELKAVCAGQEIILSAKIMEVEKDGD